MAVVKFDELTGVVVPDSSEIREDFAKGIVKAFRSDPDRPDVNVEPTSPMGQVVDLVAAEIEAKNAEIAYLANQLNPQTARGVFLDAIGGLYGIDRKLSEPSVVTCTLTGLKGTVIPYGAIVQDTNGNNFRHSAVGGAVIGDDGTVTTTFDSVEHGSVEVAPETVTKIVTIVAGWDAVTNPDSGALGRSREPDSEYLARITESYAINALGSLEAIQANLAELDGVLDCVVLENFTNEYKTEFGLRIEPHSIAVCIVGGDDEAIAETIYRRKDMGCGTTGSYSVTYIAKDHFNATYTYRITRPSAQDFKVRVTFNAESVNPYEEADVKAALIADFSGEGSNPRIKLATKVYAPRFYGVAIPKTTAPVRKIEIQLGDAGWVDSVEIPANVEPSISSENIVFVYER